MQSGRDGQSLRSRHQPLHLLGKLVLGPFVLDALLQSLGLVQEAAFVVDFVLQLLIHGHELFLHEQPLLG